MNYKKITLDTERKSFESIVAMQGDNKSRYIKATIVNKSIPLDLTGCAVKFSAIKPDMTDIFNDAVITNATLGEVEIELTNQTLAVPGVIQATLVILKEDMQLSVLPFFITVIENPYNPNAIESKSEYKALNNALTTAEGYAKELQDASVNLEEKYTTRLNNFGEQLDKSVKFKVIGEGASVPPISGGGSGGGYVHPATHPASMITGLSNVATSGLYSDLIGVPTKLSQFINDITISDGGGTSTGTISNSLDNYAGNTLNDKMVAMFNDINTNHKNTPMIIILPDGIIEITSDLKAIGWTNKILIANSYLHYKNCNAIEFIQCMHCNFYVHASSSSNLDIKSGNIIGLINPSNVGSLTKRGYKITDCSYNEFKFNNIIGFTNGIEVYSEYGAKGTFYNNIYFTAIWRCQRPIIFRTGKAADDTARQSGWITEIFVHGGMFDCNDGVLVGQEVASRPASEPSDNYQGLKFYNLGVEHVRKKENGVGIYFLQGKNNAVINPRFEGSLLTGNTTSGAYILVKESGYACNNRIETSNYPINIDRVELNYLAKQLANPNYDNPAGSYIEGDLYDNGGFRCGYKAIATPGKMVYEAKNLSNYYLQNAKANTFNYTYSNTEFAKIKCSDGTIKTIGYTS